MAYNILHVFVLAIFCISFHSAQQMYQKSKVAREGSLCDFQCTVPGYDHPIDVLKAVQKGKVKPGWQMYW